MSQAIDAPARIGSVAAELRRLGHEQLARELDAVATDLAQGVIAEPHGGVVTTGQAAIMLGVRSIATVKRWAMDGLLEGYRRGAG